MFGFDGLIPAYFDGSGAQVNRKCGIGDVTDIDDCLYGDGGSGLDGEFESAVVKPGEWFVCAVSSTFWIDENADAGFQFFFE